MKAIINNLLYDTTTSKALCVQDTTVLYKTVNGSYFKTSPEGITPLTEEETKEYLGITDADAYIKEFGTVESA